MNYNEDIFVIDSWVDTISKEKTLIDLINILKQYNIPILLTGHYPIKPEIIKLVDYYLFIKDNPIITYNEYEKYDVHSERWTDLNDCIIINKKEFHHDYAIWTTLQKSFSFVKTLGKKYIHFLEYDNLPNPEQYKQSFLEYSRNYHAIIYEYNESSYLSDYCGTFIFSIRTDIGLRMLNKIISKEEYFTNRQDGWQLERVFLRMLKEVTNSIFISKYIANDNELNIHAVWDRDGLLRNGAKFQIYLACDNNKDLFIHFISGFDNKKANKDYMVEVTYCDFKKFHEIKIDSYTYFKIGKYKKDENVKVFYQGVEVYNEILNKNFDEFLYLNKITFKNKTMEKPEKINIHFVDGPFFEVLDKNHRNFLLNFIDKKNGNIDYSVNISNNHWARPNKKYYIDWRIELKSDNFNFYYDLDLKSGRVLITMESKSLGDTLAWMPYIEEFRKKHNCMVICITFHNKLFENEYKEIQFKEPGTIVHNLLASYRLGCFFNREENTYDVNKHPIDPKSVPLQKIASDVLGLEFKEIKPKIMRFNPKKKKLITIGIHSTAQTKYWNRANGWQDVVNYLKSEGYDVLLLSSEDDGYMGNFKPKDIKQLKKGTLENVIKKIEESVLFIGISGGLSWLSWACDVPTMIISGFTDKFIEPEQGVIRIINEDVCHGCWSRHNFDTGDWNWCPEHKNTDRMFECSTMISSEYVINEIKKILNH